jgi:hypothetical protein
MRTIWVNRTGAAWPSGLAAPDASVSDLAGVVALLANS